MKYKIPKGISSIETLFRARKYAQNPISVLEQGFEAFGDTYSLRLGKQLFILTQNSEFMEYVLKKNHKNYPKPKTSTADFAKYIGHGLLTSNGDYWLKQRRLIQPQFHRQRIASLLNKVNEVSVNFIEKLPANSEINIVPFMSDFALEVIMNSIFHIELEEGFINLIKKASHQVAEITNKETAQPFRKLLYPITRADRETLKTTKNVREAIRTIVLKGMQSNEKRDDLLGMLIDAKYEDTNTSMTEEQIIDELIIFIFAGHETTANTLSWAFYLLAENENSQEQIAFHLPVGSEPNEIVKNSSLIALINEVMRLFPAAWVTDREALNDDSFEDYSYPKGTIVVPYFYGCHSNPKYWVNADQFILSRFIDDNNKVIKMNHYYPFGAGPRMCIGNSLAMAEMSLFLNALLQKFKVKKSNYTPIKKPAITLAPDKVFVTLERKK